MLRIQQLKKTREDYANELAKLNDECDFLNREHLTPLQLRIKAIEARIKVLTFPLEIEQERKKLAKYNIDLETRQGELKTIKDALAIINERINKLERLKQIIQLRNEIRDCPDFQAYTSSINTRGYYSTAGAPSIEEKTNKLNNDYTSAEKEEADKTTESELNIKLADENKLSEPGLEKQKTVEDRILRLQNSVDSAKRFIREKQAELRSSEVEGHTLASNSDLKDLRDQLDKQNDLLGTHLLTRDILTAKISMIERDDQLAQCEISSQEERIAALKKQPAPEQFEQPAKVEPVEQADNEEQLPQYENDRYDVAATALRNLLRSFDSEHSKSVAKLCTAGYEMLDTFEKHKSEHGFNYMLHTEILKTAGDWIMKPHEVSLKDSFNDLINLNVNGKPLLGKKITGACMAFAGALLAAASVIVKVLSLGLSAPFTIPGMVAGGALVAGGCTLFANGLQKGEQKHMADLAKRIHEQPEAPVLKMA